MEPIYSEEKGRVSLLFPGKDPGRVLKKLSKTLPSLLTTYKDIQKCIPFIQEQYMGPESPIPLKSFLYSQLTSFGPKNVSSIDWTSLESSIGSDILSRDEALQTSALNVLPLIPLEQSIQLITSNEQLILSVIEARDAPSMQVLANLLEVLPAYLLEVNFSLVSPEHSSARYTIQDLYISICDLAFRGGPGTEKIRTSSLKAIIKLYDKFLNRSVDSPSQFQGCGAPYKLVKHLVRRVQQRIIGKMDKLLAILNKAESIHFAADCMRVYSLVLKYVLASHEKLKSGLVVDLKEVKEMSTVYTNKAQRMLMSAVSPEYCGNLLGSLRDVIRLIRTLQIPMPEVNRYLWQGINKYFMMLSKMQKPDEGLVLISQCTKLFEPSEKVVGSLLLMSETMNCKSRFSQLLILVRAAYNLINCSISARPKGEESPLFMLFYQAWFVQLLNSPAPCEFRELIVAALTQAAICFKNYNAPPLKSWLQIAFEVADVCFRVLDWDTSDHSNPKVPPRYTASLSYVLFIEEIAGIALGQDTNTVKRIQSCLTEIAKRFTDTIWELSSIKNELTKIYSVLLVSKYWEPTDFVDGQSPSLMQLVNLVKLKLFSYEMKEDSEYDIFFDNKPELLLYSLYYFSTRFPSVKASVQELLNELEELLSEVTNKALPGRIARKFEAFRELVSIIISAIFEFYHSNQVQDIAFTEYSFLLEDEQEIKYKHDNYISDCLSSSLNILIQSIVGSRTMECESIMHNLFPRYDQYPLSFLANVYPPVREKQHYKFVEQKTVSGIADCIQIYYSYTLEPKQNCIALHFRLVNVTNFDLLQIKARLCLASGVEVDPLKSTHLLSIATLPPKQSKLWTVSVALLQSTDCQGFIQIEAESGAGKFAWRSLAFSISVSDLLLPDVSSLKSSSLFAMLYNQLPHRCYLQCRITCHPLELFKALYTKNRSTVAINQIDENKSGDQVFRYAVQSCTWFGGRVLTMIRGIYNPKLKGQQAIRAEIRCGFYRDLTLLKKQIKSYLGHISEDLISTH